jgi:hypothetical protein
MRLTAPPKVEAAKLLGYEAGQWDAEHPPDPGAPVAEAQQARP